MNLHINPLSRETLKADETILSRPTRYPLASFAFLLFVHVLGCGGETSTEPSVQLAQVTDELPAIHEPIPSPFRFTSISQEAGIDFTYYGSPSAQHYMIEQNGGGVALFDFDNDQQLDIFFANGSHFDFPANQANQFHHLYRSSTLNGKKLKFENVSSQAGVMTADFGMGVACGDFDNDGFVDLYLCTYGQNRFWKNNGDGTFTEISDWTDTGDDHWGTSAAFADLDGDGDLDLYVVNYVDYSQHDHPCYTGLNSQRVQISCGPIGRAAQADILYENLGNGKFLNVSKQTGVSPEQAGKGLAVQIVDLDHDGLLDVFVANDTTENFLLHNLGNLNFEEQGLVKGLAMGDEGLPQSSMGIACADFNVNGHFDLFVTNFENSINDFYVGTDSGGFLATNSHLGLDTTSRPMLAFGTVFADFDLDFWPDLFVANGHIWDLNQFETEHEYEMFQQLFHNESGKRFRDVSFNSGSYFQSKLLGRAVATGDIDNDGDADLVTSHEMKSAEILRNDSVRQGNSVRIKLIGIYAARQPLGITVNVSLGEIKQTMTIPSGGSFQSSSDPRIIIPIGQAEIIDSVTVIWPGGQKEQWNNLTVRSVILLLQGTGNGALSEILTLPP